MSNQDPCKGLIAHGNYQKCPMQPPAPDATDSGEPFKTLKLMRDVASSKVTPDAATLLVDYQSAAAVQAEKRLLLEKVDVVCKRYAVKGESGEYYLWEKPVRELIDAELALLDSEQQKLGGKS